MTLGIPDNDVIPVKKGRGQFQSVKQFLFPDGGAVPFIIGREIAAVLADINIMTVHRQASVARYVLRPDLIARPDFEASDPSLIGDRAYLLFVNDRQTGDIGNTLELCGASWPGYGRFPPCCAVCQIDRYQLAPGETRVYRTARDQGTSEAAHRQ